MRTVLMVLFDQVQSLDVTGPLEVFTGANTWRGGRGDGPADEHPHGLVGRRSREEPGNVGTKRVHGVDTDDHEHNAAHEQSKGKGFIHNRFSMRFRFVATVNSCSSFFPSHGCAPGNEVDEYHDDSNHQQDMNEPSHRVTAHQPQKPQNQ
jgi:hypothetical protein